MAQTKADEDPHAFDCTTCEVRKQYAAFERDEKNVHAWRLYHEIVTQFGMDTHSVGLALQQRTADYSPEEFLEVFGRLSVIYAAMHPPQDKRPQDGP